MGEHRLPLCMRHIDRRLGDGRIHIHDGHVAHVNASKEFHAVQAHTEVIARHLRGFF